LIHKDDLICYEKEALKPTLVKAYNINPAKGSFIDIGRDYNGWVLLPADTFKETIEH
jgi:hypothetical protein